MFNNTKTFEERARMAQDPFFDNMGKRSSIPEYKTPVPAPAPAPVEDKRKTCTTNDAHEIMSMFLGNVSDIEFETYDTQICTIKINGTAKEIRCGFNVNGISSRNFNKLLLKCANVPCPTGYRFSSRFDYRIVLDDSDETANFVAAILVCNDPNNKFGSFTHGDTTDSSHNTFKEWGLSDTTLSIQ